MRAEAKEKVRRKLASRDGDVPAQDEVRGAITADHEWTAEDFVRQSDALAGN
jgi:hypothetical protein